MDTLSPTLVFYIRFDPWKEVTVGTTFVFLLLFLGQWTVPLLLVPSSSLSIKKNTENANKLCGKVGPTIFSVKKKKAKAVHQRSKTVHRDTRQLKCKIKRHKRNKRLTHDICCAIQEIILRGHRKMYLKRNKEFFDLKKRLHLYDWKFHSYSHNIKKHRTNAAHLVGLSALKRIIAINRDASNANNQDQTGIT